MRGASLILVAGLALIGCVDDSGPALYIQGNIAPDSECVVAAGGTLLARGAFNPDIGVDYTFNAMFVNQLLSNASTAPPRPDPNGILMQGAEITIMDAAGGTVPFGSLPNPFTISNTAFVPSSGSASGGAGGTAPGVLTIIPAVYADELAAMAGDFQLLVSIRAFGETLGHVSVEAREFIWPIDICRDCLIDTSPDAAGSCCLIGQDRSVPEMCLLP
jgi:hypothetical protein